MVTVTSARTTPSQACPELAEGACPELAEGACPELAEGACPELAEGACPELAEGACPVSVLKPVGRSIESTGPKNLLMACTHWATGSLKG